ncbi:putative epoxide hydrolase 2 [Mollisia scopiformis]|uniref:Putative epoxide hydrolase 2 n=1 Tax=Mollisia scopiformis TaxID=149040 RepID=A0A132B2R7_MOLSC|nr:putative epoxide hydrolase 2 [Mollisia scopiformis]KUJ06698.1 putative epoxide hydrolase 2 [Mollisia scopiformis]
MALNNLSVAGKLVQLQDGIKYAYVHVAAKESKPTFLLLHGFPSSSYDWRFQVRTLTSLGYGVVVPDLLGYGDTDKPTEPEAYGLKKMATDFVEILNKESIGTVIGVGHDWGVGLLSRLLNYFPDKFSAVVFVSVPYMEPSDAMNAMTEQLFGYPTFGYWEFFNDDDAAEICDHHNESFTSLVYPHDPELWKTHLGPRGAAKAWITANTITALPQWLSESEVTTHNQILAKGGYVGPLNWYKATIRGLHAGEDALIPEDNKFVNVPALVILSDNDYVTRAEVAMQLSPARLKNYTIKKLEGCGHWIQLEKRDEFSQMLVDFAEGQAN